MPFHPPQRAAMNIQPPWQIDADHWLSGVARCLSPNCDQRLNPLPSMLVIHAISLPAGCWQGDDILALFSNTLNCDIHPSYASLVGMRVSAHLLIRRDGQIIQCVPFDQRAWHAGRSYWQGQTNLNDCAIGVELEGLPTVCFTQRQYDALARVTRTLIAYYPALTPERIVGHGLIAPLRKDDPGPAFDWQLFRRCLAS